MYYKPSAKGKIRQRIQSSTSAADAHCIHRIRMRLVGAIEAAILSVGVTPARINEIVQGARRRARLYALMRWSDIR